jgi:uncharacterized integral membrane protein
MATSWHKIKTYARMGGTLFVLALALLFMVINRKPVTVNFLWITTWEVPTYAFIFLVANGGIVLFLICRRTKGVWHDMRQLQNERRARQKLIKEVEQEVLTKTTKPANESE